MTTDTELSDELIIKHLKNNPDLIKKLIKLNLFEVNAQNNITSLNTYKIQQETKKRLELESILAQLKENAKRNEKLFEQIQSISLEWINTSSLENLHENVLISMQEIIQIPLQ